MRSAVLCLLAVLWSSAALAQASGKLQIHYISVGQGDAAVLISPLGEVVLFDTGPSSHCQADGAYLGGLGIARSTIIASH